MKRGVRNDDATANTSKLNVHIDELSNSPPVLLNVCIHLSSSYALPPPFRRIAIAHRIPRRPFPFPVPSPSSLVTRTCLALIATLSPTSPDPSPPSDDDAADGMCVGGGGGCCCWFRCWFRCTNSSPMRDDQERAARFEAAQQAKKMNAEPERNQNNSATVPSVRSIERGRCQRR
jgi:hypothetical protein